MAKTASKKKSAEPEFSTYTIKQMDRAMWERFTSKVHGDGRTVRFVLEKLVQGFAAGQYRIDA